MTVYLSRGFRLFPSQLTKRACVSSSIFQGFNDTQQNLNILLETPTWTICSFIKLGCVPKLHNLRSYEERECETPGRAEAGKV